MNPEHQTPLSYLIEKKTYTLTILFFLVLGLSIISMFKIPIEVLPKENTPPYLYIRIPSNEPSTPEKNEMELTLPVEGVLRTIANVVSLNSSTDNRGATLSMGFKPKTNLDLSTLSILDSLQDLENQKKLNLKNISITRLSPDATAIIKISIQTDQKLNNFDKIVNDELRVKIEAIEEVSKAEVIGIDSPQYHFTIKKSKIMETGLSAQEFLSQFQMGELRENLGLIGSPSASIQKSVRASSLPTQIKDLRAKRLSNESDIQLQSLAKETIMDPSQEEVNHINGIKTVFVEVYLKESANAFDFEDKILKLFSNFKNDNSNLRHIKYQIILNKVSDLKNAIDDVFSSLYQAMIITFFVVLIFLRNIRETLLISITIPLTLLITVLFMQFNGISLNLLTLSGLILCIGMVIDNAILVVEQTGEYLAEFPLKIAVSKAAERSATALILSTLTNAVIFLPVAFLEGGDSFTDLLKAFQVPIIASLVASLIVALFFLPLMIYFWKPSQKQIPQEASTKIQDNTLKKLINFFTFIQNQKFSIAIVSFIFITWIFEKSKLIEQTDLEQPKEPFLTLQIKYGPEVSPNDRGKLFSEVEQSLLKSKKELSYQFLVSEFNKNGSSGTMILYPISSEDVDQEVLNLNLRVSKFIKSLQPVPGQTLSTDWNIFDMSQQSPKLVLSLTGGKSTLTLNELIRFKKTIEILPEIETISYDKDEVGQKLIQFTPLESALSKHKLSPAEVAREVASSMGSAFINQIQVNGQPVSSKIIIEPDHGKWDLDQLKSLTLITKNKKEYSLSDLGFFETQNELRSISRKSGSTTSKLHITFKRNLSEANLMLVKQKIWSKFKTFDFQIGYGPTQSQSQQNIQEMESKGNFIILLSAFLIYLILASMFESLFIPLSIIFTLPLAVLFGIFGLILFSMNLDVMARLSLIILVGISVNNAIILIDLILNLKKQGFRKSEAIVRGCAMRFKSVAMTTAIQIIGVIPIALGKSKIMGIPYASLGISIISGMFFSTVLTLMILPFMYDIADEIEVYFKGK